MVYTAGNADTTCVVSVIVTHNGRIRCLLRTIDPTIDVKKTKFKNCCVLRFSLDNTKQIAELEMIHPGELSKTSTEKRYYVNDMDSMDNMDNTIKTAKNEASFTKRTYVGNDYIRVIRNLGLDTIARDTKTYSFYIVRHGEGTHNVASQFGKILGFVANTYMDPVLTSDGEKQAVNAGAALKKHLKKSGQSLINFLFCSDLRRTRETLDNMNLHTDEHKRMMQTHILPCSHELDYDVEPNQNKCYEDTFLSVLADENKMSCYLMESSDGKHCKRTDKGYFVNWIYYKKQYEGKARSYFHKNEVCSVKTMLSHAINIINDPNFSSLRYPISN